MEWLVVGVIVLAIFGAIGKAMEKNKKQEEARAAVDLRKVRAEEARQAILKSGDPELIKKLHLMEANYQAAPAPVSAGGQRGGPSALGTAAAVAGGMMVGNAISGAVQAAQLETALADIEADLATNAGDIDALPDPAESVADSPDFDFEI